MVAADARLLHCSSMSEPVPVFGRPIVASERAGNLIAQEIRRAIIEGRLEPGDLLREEQLAHELGTSRTPVREALIELRNEGLVESTATRRAIVRSYDDDELRDLYELRAALEAHAAGLAAARADAAVVAELEASNERLRGLVDAEVEDVQQLIAENIVFHTRIGDATRVPRLKKMIEQVMVIPRRYRADAAYAPDLRSTIERDHRAIAEAIAARNVAAAQEAMAEHVRWTGEIAVAAQRTAKG
jgi:DNA-binding GntR family transcriptional regulator